MAELLYSVKKVFTAYPNGKTYNIPDYQRGYKWTEQQVNQLLDDIFSFSITKKDDHFYCLQNITLFQNLDNNELINVVDGQQRLTTVTLLLAYLNENNIVKNKLLYAVREPSNQFIQQIIVNQSGFIDAILSAESFDTYIANNAEELDYQDVYHMFSALRTINTWFKAKETGFNLENFKETLLHQVKLIVNKVEGIKEEELFMNLNAGKVHLDGSDLIRAILITRVAKQELDDYDANNVEDILKLNQRRTRIGWELDEMNNWWSNTDVKDYFKNFTKIQTGKKETVKFNQDLHPINLLYKIWVEVNGKTEIALHHFESIEAIKLYQSILKLHRILQDWYQDREIYHYLGFLFANATIKIKTVYNQWTNQNTTRDGFVNIWCIQQLQEAVFGKVEEDNTEEAGYGFWMNKVKDYNSEDPTNWYNTSIIQKILVLLDIIAHSELKEQGVPLPFLKPRYFRNYKEDKEHIFSGTPKELKELKELSNPIEKLNQYIDALNADYEVSKHIPHFKFSEDQWDALPIQEQTTELNNFKNTIHKKRPINSLGNLVLLHLTINRGFGNNAYVLKRKEVIKNTLNGLYVRQHTTNAFIKITESKDLNNWTLKDIEANADNIYNTLENFFKPIVK